MTPHDSLLQVGRPISNTDTLGFVAPFRPDLSNNHLHFYLEEEVGGLTRSVCNPLDSLVPAPSQPVEFDERSPHQGSHNYKIYYVRDRYEGIDQHLWETTATEYVLRDSVDVIGKAYTTVQGMPTCGIYGMGYGVEPVGSGETIAYRSMLVMRGMFEVADSLAYYHTYADSVSSHFDNWYIVTNCGDSVPSLTKGISNIEENCWPTRVDTSGTGVATRNEEARFPDGWYDVFLKAWSDSGDTAAVHDTVFVGNFTPIVNRALVRQTRGARDSTTVYDAHWEEGELVVDTDEPVRMVPGDVLEVELLFSEGLHDTIRVTLEGPYAGLPFATVRWDSVVHPRDRWVGRFPLTTWDSIRNLMSGDRRLVIWAEDAVTRNALDTNPATAAYWDAEAEEWVGYEGDDGLPGQTGGHDRVHRLQIAPFKDVCLLVDASPSMILAGWELSQVRAPQKLIEWMMAQEDSEDWRVAAWRFWSTVDQLADYSDDLDDAWSSLGLYAGPQSESTNEPGQTNPVNPPGWMPMTDVENGLLEAATCAMAEYDDPKVICIWSDFWHNFGASAEEVEATFQQVAEWDPLFLFGNDAAMHGCQCSEEMREAARISGGGYFEGFGAAEVESLYRVIPPAIESRAFLAGVEKISGGVDTHGMCHASCRHPAQMVGTWAMKEGEGV